MLPTLTLLLGAIADHPVLGPVVVLGSLAVAVASAGLAIAWLLAKGRKFTLRDFLIFMTFVALAMGAASVAYR